MWVPGYVRGASLKGTHKGCPYNPDAPAGANDRPIAGYAGGA